MPHHTTPSSLSRQPSVTHPHSPRTPSRLSHSINFIDCILDPDTEVENDSESISKVNDTKMMHIINTPNSNRSPSNHGTSRAEDLSAEWERLFDPCTFLPSRPSSRAQILNSEESLPTPTVLPNLDDIYEHLLAVTGESSEVNEQGLGINIDSAFDQLEFLLKDMGADEASSDEETTSRPFVHSDNHSRTSSLELTTPTQAVTPLPLNLEAKSIPTAPESKMSFLEALMDDEDTHLDPCNLSSAIPAVPYISKMTLGMKPREARFSVDSDNCPSLSPPGSVRSSYSSLHSRTSSAFTLASSAELTTPTSISHDWQSTTLPTNGRSNLEEWDSFIGKVFKFKSPQNKPMPPTAAKPVAPQERIFPTSFKAPESIAESPLEEAADSSIVSQSSQSFAHELEEPVNLHDLPCPPIPTRCSSRASPSSTRTVSPKSSSKVSVLISPKREFNLDLALQRSPSVVSASSNSSSYTSFVVPYPPPSIPSRGSSLSDDRSIRSPSRSSVRSSTESWTAKKENVSPPRSSTPDLFRHLTKHLPSRGRIPLFSQRSEIHSRN